MDKLREKIQRFGGIQFNTALKLRDSKFENRISFGGIQFNTALNRARINSQY